MGADQGTITSALMADANFRAIAEATFDAMFVLDSGRVLYANAAGEELFGYTAEELLGSSAAALAAPASRASVAAHIRSGSDAPYQATGQRKDGSCFLGELRGRSIRCEGHALRVTAIRDLTEQRRVSVELGRSDAKLAALVSQLPVIAWSTDRDLRIVSSGGGGLAVLGWRPGQLVGQPLADVLAGDPGAGQALRAHERAVSGEQVVYSLPFAGRHYQTMVVPDTDGAQIVGVTALTIDITELRRAEQTVERTASLLRATIESTADGLMVEDAEDQIQIVNQRFVELWRLPADARMPHDGARLREVMAAQGRDPAGFRARIAEIRARPEEPTFDVLELSDGRVLERYSSPQRLGTEVVGRVSSFRDVTPVHEAMAERDRRYHEAQAALAARDEFLSIASHELYTPLSSLLLALEALRGLPGTTPLEPARRASLLEISGRQVSRLSSLVSGLLDVTRLRGGRLSLEPESVDLGEVVREVAERFAHDLERAGCALAISDDRVRGRWDRLRLEQVVTNLLSNAIKYGAGTAIAVAVVTDGDDARLTVTDGGIGIAPEQQPLLFERFARAAPARHYGGLGLGLYIARSVVEAHGGSIEVTSRLGEGASFTVRLPREPRP